MSCIRCAEDFLLVRMYLVTMDGVIFAPEWALLALLGPPALRKLLGPLEDEADRQRSLRVSSSDSCENQSE